MSKFLLGLTVGIACYELLDAMGAAIIIGKKHKYTRSDILGPLFLFIIFGLVALYEAGMLT